MHFPLIWHPLPLISNIFKFSKADLIFVTKEAEIRQNYGFKKSDIYDFLNTYIDENIKNIKIKNSHFSFYKLLLLNDYDYLLFGSWDKIGDIIQLFLGIVIAKIRGKKVIIWNNIRWRGNSLPFKVKLVDFVVGLILKFSTNVICGSTLSKKYVKKSLKVSEEKIKVFLNPSEIWLEQKKIDKIYKNLLNKNQINITFIGREFMEVKGTKYLIQAYKNLKKKYPHISLFLIGSENEKLDNKYDIFRLKSVKPQEISDIYKHTNIFVLPSVETSVGIVEGWGLVINEAYQHSIPVVVTDKVGCNVDIVKDYENGFVVKEKSIKDLELKLEILILDKKLREKMGMNNRNLFDEKLRYEIIAKNWAKFLDSLK